MDKLYDFVFWNNTYTQTWYAIPRDKYLEFFVGKTPAEKVEGVISNKDINVLIERVKVYA